jgi:hypothetical protein
VDPVVAAQFAQGAGLGATKGEKNGTSSSLSLGARAKSLSPFPQASPSALTILAPKATLRR